MSNNRTIIRRKTTNLKKYGASNPLKSTIGKEKRKETMLKKYGTEFPLQCEELRNKVKEKNNDRSSDEWVIINKKRKDTNIKKYGVANLWELPEFVNKINQTNLDKYGTKWVQQNTNILSKRIQSRKKQFVDKLISRFPNISPAFDIENYNGINVYRGGSSYMWHCDVCKLSFEKIVKSDVVITCPLCFPENKSYQSNGEREIAEFLTELSVDFNLHDRQLAKPYEIDFIIPKYFLAIEYCGLYWHSDKKVDKNYHSRKKDLCNKQNIKLITIFEDEWIEKKDICKARIQFLLGKAKKLCGARQTTIAEISSKEYRNFVNQHHLQGYTPAKVKIGAYYCGEIVAVMSFGGQRTALGSRKEDCVFELIRYVSEYNIPGIASRLFSYFVKQYSPKKIISYCDLRWGSGGLYEKLGFQLKSQTAPNYWYSSDGLHRFHRFQFRKQVLVKKGFDPSMTESDIMENLGYYKIYDCGNYKFEWES
ncbi:MAG: hypothetical protein HC836_22600 [Richelia sp. RM2_1_2]|nr:hypothetical protein [Richelia sp. RM2_1_2]